MALCVKITNCQFLIIIGKRAITAVIIAYVVFKLWKTWTKHLAPIVKTDLGDLQGVTSISRDGREYHEYLGIPYARSPVGPLRFEDPVEPEKWNGVRIADKYGNECIQLQIFGIPGRILGDEDCLFLNVFVPKRTVSSSSGLLPTMVYIHGGLFLEGSGNMYRPDYFMDKDVVLVTLNYRLSAFGFLNTGDGIVRGNAGLKDQTKALQFIKRNIVQFGGDPNRLTIFGESAGAVCVELHILSPLSQGLFHKAITQSGSALSQWAIGRSPGEQAARLGAFLKCPTDNTRSMVECLKKLPAHEIVATFVAVKDTLQTWDSYYAPSLEVINDKKAFLTEEPEAVMNRLKSGVPLLSGVNSHDGFGLLGFIVRNHTLQMYLANSSNWLRSMPNLLLLKHVKPEVMKQVQNYYFGEVKAPNFEKYFQNYTNLFTDVLFNYAFMESVKSHSQHSTVYAYHFSYPGEFSLFNTILAFKGKYPALLEGLIYVTNKWITKHIFRTQLPHYGVSHFDELAYLFKLELLNDITPKDKDYEMSKKMIELWTTFAYDEKLLKYNNLAWKPFDPEKKAFEVLKIDRKAEYIQAPYTERLKFLKTSIFKSEH